MDKVNKLKSVLFVRKKAYLKVIYIILWKFDGVCELNSFILIDLLFNKILFNL